LVPIAFESHVSPVHRQTLLNQPAFVIKARKVASLDAIQIKLRKHK